jgi:hypothetical protein
MYGITGDLNGCDYLSSEHIFLHDESDMANHLAINKTKCENRLRTRLFRFRYPLIVWRASCVVIPETVKRNNSGGREDSAPPRRQLTSSSVVAFAQRTPSVQLPALVLRIFIQQKVH